MLLRLGVLLLFTYTFCQNTKDVTDDAVTSADLGERDVFFSNETNEGNSQTEKEVDLESSTGTFQETSEAEFDGDLEGTHEFCGKPPAVSHAIMDSLKRVNYEVGTELKYSCEFGYSADGANHISRCIRDGDKLSWTDPGIICIPRSCGDPGFVTNAQRIGSRFTFPNQVSFECDDGYEMRGSNIRYCQVNGRWSGSLPSCEKIFCYQPFHPENGRVRFTSLEYGSQLQYECEKGFILKKHQTRVCTENGTWSGSEPLCLDAQCDQPDAPDHGFVEVVGGNPRVGSIAIFKCESGRALIGSATSKCLDIGEWTFPVPKCVEPCVVPSVDHGIIGRYESKRYSRQKTFKQLPEGTALSDGEELYLRCDDLYEPFGENQFEEKIVCEKGFWKETPICSPAKCRQKPPTVQNTRGVKISNNDHGNYVVYFCAQHFKKKPGNVTCQFGTWRGTPPTCSDRRCYADRIHFPAFLKKGRKNMFRNGEALVFECEKGYDVAGSDNKLTCEEGAWKGQLPPCKAANCATSPPSLQNGRIKSYSEMHSSVVTYECNEGYLLQQSSSGVMCLFGEWSGDPPICKDGRCYFQTLTHKKGVMPPDKDPVNNGDALTVRCASGYSVLQNIRPPFCSNGQWTEFGTSPCAPNSCRVFRIDNGAFTERHERTVWKWNGRATEYTFREARIDSEVPDGKGLFVSCVYGYSFQGGNSMDVQVLCSEGRWKPTSVCLPYGTQFEEKSSMPATTNLAARSSNPIKTSSTAIFPERQPLQPSSIDSSTDLLHTEAPKAGQKEANECYCIYEGCDDLIAYSDHQLLQPGSKVKSNASVKFHCKHFGYHRFMGFREIVCTGCRQWHSSEYPSCVVPVRGDVIIQFDESTTILPGGIISMDRGIDTQLTCLSYGMNEYPTWSSTVARDAFVTIDAYDEQNGFSNVLSISNADQRHSGYYRCSVAGKRVREIQVFVKNKCRKFDENEEYSISYDNRQEVNSSVLFTCKNLDRKLEGPKVMTCMSNGEWSGQPPRCVPRGCPSLPETDTMLITYSHEMAIGSTATFHCFSPGVRKGNSFIKCLPNGEWSGDTPSCTVPRCALEKLFDHIPENVVPRMEDVTNDTFPFGHELRLACEGDLRLTEAAATARCEKNGIWGVPKVDCVPGCSPIQVPPGSNLIVIPERDSYRFGEFVSLECIPGHILSVEVEIVMCLRNGWSESSLPMCVEPPLLA